jgi:TP901 family phage tail tape measure protein
MAGRERLAVSGGGGLVINAEISGVPQVGKGLDVVAEKYRTTSDAMAGLRASLLFLSFGMLAAGGLMSRAASVFDKAVKSMITTFSDVEYRTSVVGTIMGATAQQTDTLRETMLQLGRDTEWTAVQAGEAMERLAMAGLNVHETIGAAEGTLKLATIGMVDTATAADLAVGMLRGFNLETSTASETAGGMTVIVSELAQAATHSATTVEELANAMKFVAATAEAAGISMEESIAVLMISADNMVRAGIAGRALRQSLIRLSQTAGGVAESTKGAAEMMEELGVELVDEYGDVKNLADIVDELNVAFEGMASAEVNSALAALFGARAMTMWAALLREGGDAIRERELALTAAASKEAIFMKTSEDSTELLLKWRSQVQDAEVDTADLATQLTAMGFAGEEVDAILTTITSDLENATEVIEDAALASAITKERLETLHGTIILFQSSLEALYATLGQELVPIFMLWNKLLREFADWLSEQDSRLKMLIAILILAGYIFTTLGSKILLTTGTLVMMAAAVVLLNKQQGHGMTMSALFGQAIRTLGVTAKRAAASLGLLTLRVMMLSAAVGVLLVTLSYAQYAWEQGDYAAAALSATIGVLTVVYTAYMLVRKTEIWATIRQMYLTWGLTKAYIAQKLVLLGLTRANLAATWAMIKLNTALYACPVLLIAFAFLAFTQDLYFLGTALVIAAIAVWAFNKALLANPLILMITALTVVILLLAELVKHFEEVTNAFKGGWDWFFGSPDTIFDHLAWGADAASASVAGLGASLRASNKEWKKSAKFSEMIGATGPRAPPAMQQHQRVITIVNPSSNVQMGGVRIAGSMQADQLRTIVSDAADEANRRLISSFAAETEEETK